MSLNACNMVFLAGMYREFEWAGDGESLASIEVATRDLAGFLIAQGCASSPLAR